MKVFTVTPSTRRVQVVGSLVTVVVLSAATLCSGRVVVAPRHDCPGDKDNGGEGSGIRHLHLSVGKDPSTQMTVSFASEWAEPGVKAPLGGVHLGTVPTNLDRFVGESELPDHYVSNLFHHDDEPYYSPYQHHITIDGLEPSTTYYYVAVVGKRTKGIDALAKKPFLGNRNQAPPTSPHPGVHESLEAESKIMRGQDKAGDRDHESNLLRRAHRRLGPPPYDGHEHACLNGWKVRSFTTAPAPGSIHATSASFAIVGDLGQFVHSQETMQHMKRHRDEYDVALLVGDIAYTEFDHRRWDTFFDFLDDFSAFDQLPLQIATGNHDIDKQENSGQIFQAYETRFRMPQVHPPELGIFDGPHGLLNLDAPPYPLPYEWGNAYYSFDYGPAKHIVVSAYSSMEPGSKQYAWVVEELQNVNRDITPWVLVTIHTPLYSTFDKHHHDLQIVAARQHMEPLFVKNYVNVIFTGHIHAYQRTHNVAMDVLDETGPLHITVGAGGRNCDAPFMSEEPEHWVAHRDASHYGYGKFQIFNSTHAHWQWIRLTAADKHDYNQVKGADDMHLPPLDQDTTMVQNQYFLARR